MMRHHVSPCSVVAFAVAAALVVVGPAATPVRAQQSEAARKLARCVAILAKVPQVGFITTKDSATIAITIRLQEARIDSVRALAQQCVATLDAAAVPDSMLLSLLDLQRQADRLDDATVTAARVVRVASASPAERVRDFDRVVMALPSNRAVLALARQVVLLADSAEDRRSQFSARARVATMTRKIDPLAAYRAAQESLDFLERLPITERSMLQGAVGALTYSLAQWSAVDSNPMYAVGFAARASALLGTAPDFLRAATFDLHRISIVDTKALPFESKYWLNMPDSVRRIDMADGKVRLVEFTAEWCLACKATYRPIQALYQELAPQGFEAVFCVPNEGTEDKIVGKYQALFSHYGVEFPVVVDETGKTANHYIVSSLPHFLIVDRKGVVRDVFMGWEADRARTLITRLLAER